MLYGAGVYATTIATAPDFQQDAFFLSQSVEEFSQDKSVVNALAVGADVASMALPAISVGAVTRAALSGAEIAGTSPYAQAMFGGYAVGSLYQAFAPTDPLAAARKGQKVHKNYQYPAGYEKEVTLNSGKRVDALNESTQHIIELKPDNPQAIQKGIKQLKGYLNELCPGWTGNIWTY